MTVGGKKHVPNGGHLLNNGWNTSHTQKVRDRSQSMATKYTMHTPTTRSRWVSTQDPKVPSSPNKVIMMSDSYKEWARCAAKSRTHRNASGHAHNPCDESRDLVKQYNYSNVSLPWHPKYCFFTVFCVGIFQTLQHRLYRQEPGYGLLLQEIHDVLKEVWTQQHAGNFTLSLVAEKQEAVLMTKKWQLKLRLASR